MVEQHSLFLSSLKKGTVEVMYLAQEPQHKDPIKAST